MFWVGDQSGRGGSGTSLVGKGQFRREYKYIVCFYDS